MRPVLPTVSSLAAVLLGTMALPACAADATLVPWTAASGAEPPAPWHVSGLPHQSKPFTRFTVDRSGGAAVLRIEADRSYGNLVHVLPDTRQFHHLAWQWQLDEPLPDADLRVRGAEDAAVRVCVLFDLPMDKVPLLERAVLAATRSSSGEELPSASVCYVWDVKLPPGTQVESPFTARMRTVVLRGGESPLHRMLAERRDIDADFKRLFGNESEEVPPVRGVLVGADADNTQGHSLASVGAIRLEP